MRKKSEGEELKIHWLTVAIVVPEAVDCVSLAFSTSPHTNTGIFFFKATRYFGWLW